MTVGEPVSLGAVMEFAQLSHLRLQRATNPPGRLPEGRLGGINLRLAGRPASARSRGGVNAGPCAALARLNEVETTNPCGGSREQGRTPAQLPANGQPYWVVGQTARAIAACGWSGPRGTIAKGALSPPSTMSGAHGRPSWPSLLIGALQSRC
jgi:hypothetical protein